MYELQAFREGARAALASFELIGEGEWTPQDSYGHSCAMRLIKTLDALEVAEVEVKHYKAALERIKESGTTYVESIYPDALKPPEQRRPNRRDERLNREAWIAREALTALDEKDQDATS